MGDITLPAAMGAIVAQISPESLFYFTFVGVIISAGTAVVMFLTACLQKRRLSTVHDHKPVVRVKYRQLAEDNNTQLEDTDDVTEKTCANGTAVVEVDIM